MNEIDDMLDGSGSSAAPAKTKKTKKIGADKKPGKVKVTKPAKDAKPVKKAAKSAANGKDAKPAKKAAKSAANGKDAKPAKEKKTAPAVGMTQPQDDVTIKAVRKLKEPTMASKIAADMGVHRRAIRAQLQRLAKEKGSGIAMKKIGFNWMVTNTLK